MQDFFHQQYHLHPSHSRFLHLQNLAFCTTWSTPCLGLLESVKGTEGDGSGKIVSKKTCKVSSQKESNLPIILFLVLYEFEERQQLQHWVFSPPKRRLCADFGKILVMNSPNFDKGWVVTVSPWLNDGIQTVAGCFPQNLARSSHGPLVSPSAPWAHLGFLRIGKVHFKGSIGLCF